MSNRTHLKFTMGRWLTRDEYDSFTKAEIKQMVKERKIWICNYRVCDKQIINVPRWLRWDKSCEPEIID